MLPLVQLLSVAAAAEPTLSVDSAGTVQVEAIVEASQGELRALVADPQSALSLTSDVLSVKTLAKGDCLTLGVTVKGAWSPLAYTSQRCPTATGYHYALLRSDDITAYEAEWKFDPLPSGETRVTYRLKTEVDLPVPQSLIRKGVIASAQETIAKLVAKVKGK